MLMPIRPTIWTTGNPSAATCSSYKMVQYRGTQKSKLQSTCETKIKALVFASQALWLRNLAKELDSPMVKESTVIFSDNKAALNWAQTQAYKPKTKHIDVDCKFIREHIEVKNIEVKFMERNDSRFLNEAFICYQTQLL